MEGFNLLLDKKKLRQIKIRLKPHIRPKYAQKFSIKDY